MSTMRVIDTQGVVCPHCLTPWPIVAIQNDEVIECHVCHRQYHRQGMSAWFKSSDGYSVLVEGDAPRAKRKGG